MQGVFCPTYLYTSFVSYNLPGEKGIFPILLNVVTPLSDENLVTLTQYLELFFANEHRSIVGLDFDSYNLERPKRLTN